MKIPWAEIGIVLSSVTLVGILTYPQYKNYREEETDGTMKYNLHVFQISMEKYAVYYKGFYPKSIHEMDPYFESPGSYPINPFTQKPLQKEEIKIFYYPRTRDNHDNSLDGIHGQQRGPQGGIGVGLYILPEDSLVQAESLSSFEPPSSVETLPPVDSLVQADSLDKRDSLVTEYGIIGFDREGVPIKIEDPSGRDYIFLLRNSD